MSIVALDDFCTSRLIGTDDFSILFGVELRREFGGIDQIAEHHRELPSFRVGRRSRRLYWLRRGCGRGFRSVPSPHEYSAIFIHGELLCFDDLCLQGFEILVA